MRDAALNGMVYFEAVARHARVTTAAEELMVSSSAVSQQIKALEENLGVSLFRRVKRRLILTEEGERLYQSAAEALGILREARRKITRKRDFRKLILRVSASFGVRWLGPRIARFVDENPTWDLHIDATPELTDFEKENVDLDIRYGQRGRPGLYSETILHDNVLPLCAPDFVAHLRRGGTDPVDVLANVRLIHTVKAALTWRRWQELNQISGIATEGGLRFDRSSMSLQAAMDGAGVVLETATLSMNELRSGALVPMFPELGTVRFPSYWMICPGRHLNRRAVKVFAEWVRAETAAHEARRARLLESLGCQVTLDTEIAA